MRLRVVSERPQLTQEWHLRAEYVQLKPILAAVTMILKLTGTYNDGSLRKDSGCAYTVRFLRTAVADLPVAHRSQTPTSLSSTI